jgi:AraC family transcriptional regulator
MTCGSSCRAHEKIELLSPQAPQLENQLLHRASGSHLTRWWCRVPFEEATEEHTRDAHTLVIVRDGSYIVENPRGRGLVDVNSVALYNPHEPFVGSHPNGCGDDGWAILLSPELARQVLERHQPWTADLDVPAFPAPVAHLSSRARLRHRLLLAELENRSEGLAIDEALHALLDEMAGSLFTHRRRPVMRTPEVKDPRPYVERAALYLARNFRGSIRLSDVGKASYTSMFHLCRLFKRETGCTMHQYLTRLRLNAALDLLPQPRTSIWEIARSVGFVAHSHFTAAFRREFGCTPSHIRRALSSRRDRELLRRRLRPFLSLGIIDRQEGQDPVRELRTSSPSSFSGCRSASRRRRASAGAAGHGELGGPRGTSSRPPCAERAEDTRRRERQDEKCCDRRHGELAPE